MDFQRTLSRRLQLRGVSRRLEQQWSAPAAALVLSDAETLAGSETDALAIVYTDDHFKATTGFNGSVFCVDSGTPANDTDSSPTTEASSYFTYTSPSPKMILHDDGELKYAAHNLATYSEDWTNAAWSKNGNSAATANAAVAPNGETTADLLYVTGSSGNPDVQQNYTYIAGATYRWAVRVKAAGYNYVRMRMYFNTTSVSQVFNLSAGTVGTAGSNNTGNTKTTNITALGDGWYLCELVGTPSSISGGGNFMVAPASTDSEASFTGDGSSGIYVWGAHLHRYPADTTYLKTTSASRFADCIEFNSSGTALGALVEPQRTNLVLYNTQFENAWWTEETIATISAGSITAPNGLDVAETLTASSGGGAHDIYSTLITGLTASATYTQSWYIKKGTHRYVYVRNIATTEHFVTAVFDLDGGGSTATETDTGTNSGTLVSTSMVAVGNGWYRVSIASSTTQTQLYVSIGFAHAATGNTFDATGNVTFTAAGTETFHVWGAQLELGSAPTSLIETSGSSVTRAADNISKATSGFPYGTTYTQYVECEILDLTSTGAGRSIMAIDNATSSNEFLVYRDASSANVAIYATSGGGLQISTTAAGTLTSGGNKLAFAVDTNDAALVLDGTVEFTDNTVTLIAATTVMRIGYNVAGNGPGHMYVKSHLFVPRRVSNADMQTLTSTGALP